MTEYIVLANKHRVVKKTTENGETIRTSTIYKKGDKITLSSDDANRLLRSGGIAEIGEDGEPVLATAGARLPNSTVVPVSTGDRIESPGALSGQVADEGLREATKPSPEALEAHAATLAAQEQARKAHAESQGGGGGEVPDDGYDDLDYPQLQAEAKQRELEHTGKKKEIIARLRAYDADQDNGEDEDDSNGGTPPQ